MMWTMGGIITIITTTTLVMIIIITVVLGLLLLCLHLSTLTTTTRHTIIVEDPLLLLSHIILMAADTRAVSTPKHLLLTQVHMTHPLRHRIIHPPPRTTTTPQRPRQPIIITIVSRLIPHTRAFILPRHRRYMMSLQLLPATIRKISPWQL
jgi:hypothetical protein